MVTEWLEPGRKRSPKARPALLRDPVSDSVHRKQSVPRARRLARLGGVQIVKGEAAVFSCNEFGTDVADQRRCGFLRDMETTLRI